MSSAAWSLDPTTWSQTHSLCCDKNSENHNLENPKMKVSVSVFGHSQPNGTNARCYAELDVEELDAEAISRLRGALRSCGEVIASNACDTGGNDRYQSRPSGSPRPATEKQVRAIHAMATRQGIDLSETLHNRFSVASPKALTIRQASELIDNLKSSLQSA